MPHFDLNAGGCPEDRCTGIQNDNQWRTESGPKVPSWPRTLPVSSGRFGAFSPVTGMPPFDLKLRSHTGSFYD